MWMRQNYISAAGGGVSFSPNLPTGEWLKIRMVRVSGVFEAFVDQGLGFVSKGTTSHTRSFTIDQIGRYDSNTQSNFDIKSLSLTVNGIPTLSFNPSLSNGTGTILHEEVSGNHGTLIGFPSDNSQWVYYEDLAAGPEEYAGALLATGAAFPGTQGSKIALALAISHAISAYYTDATKTTGGDGFAVGVGNTATAGRKASEATATAPAQAMATAPGTKTGTATLATPAQGSVTGPGTKTGTAKLVTPAQGMATAPGTKTGNATMATFAQGTTTGPGTKTTTASLGVLSYSTTWHPGQKSTGGPGNASAYAVTTFTASSIEIHLGALAVNGVVVTNASATKQSTNTLQTISLGQTTLLSTKQMDGILAGISLGGFTYTARKDATGSRVAAAKALLSYKAYSDAVPLAYQAYRFAGQAVFTRILAMLPGAERFNAQPPITRINGVLNVI
ncbi:hypothetical protein IT774_05205 [Salinimonas marina]|uniref:Uncharacterized protein n=1 Tax=Salinimonas marina TaxID=2785918 RepID=A0A7S9DZ89_9ALTE|nr:hypothetical protein [Salinimonas marina]QPG06572.1 hypothetical protein IT774_05205 [Salinimonas marina]